MKFSIIIINYKTKEITKDCLDSIFSNCKNDFEIVLIDNNSNDGSTKYLKDKFGSRINIVENSSNLGFGKGNNIGSNYASGEYLFFLNSDTVIKSDVLKDFDDFIYKIENNKNNFKLGLLAPKLILENGLEQKDAYGSFPNIYNTIFSKLFNLNNKFRKESKSIKEVDWVSGAAFIIKKEIFEKINGFDESFFMYFEDVDLSKRIKDLGFSNLVNENINIVYLGGRSLKKFNLRKKYYYESQDYYFKKHYGVIIMIVMKILRFPFRLINNIYLILKK